jgi:hypothetical protein
MISPKRMLACSVVGVLCGSVASAQSLQVTSPTGGTPYAPGDPIHISVSAQGSFASVTIVGQDIGTAPKVLRPPYSFTLITPNEVSGIRTLTAVGITGSGQVAFSTPVAIDIESSAAVASLHPNLTNLHFRYIGQQIKVSTLGTFTDGSAADVSSSSRITYTSQNSGVVKAGSDGTLTATGVGETTVAIAAGSVSITIEVSVNEETSRPTIAGLPGPGCTLWPPNHKLVRVAIVAVTTTDASGIQLFDVTGTSNEPSDPSDPDIVITGSGAGPRVVQLRADRLGNGNGRTYTLNATAINGAGALQTAQATCTVPHDQGR